MKKRWMKLLAAVLAAVMLTGCSWDSMNFTLFSPIQERTAQTVSSYAVEISPAVQSDTMKSKQAVLFFRLGETQVLSPMLVSFSLSVDTTLEEAIIDALLSGPAGQHELTSTIPDGTELVSAKERDGYFEVTLSSEFLEVGEDVPDNWQQDAQWVQEVSRRRKLAAYSIVNSITQLGAYSRVLILIDTSGSGNGQRVERSYFGLMPQAGEEDTLIEPLARDASLLMTPNKAAAMVLDALVGQDTDYLARYLCFEDEKAPDAQSISETLFKKQMSSYRLDTEHGAVISPDGINAVISFDYEYLTAQGTRQEETDIPLLLVLEDGIWRASYESLCSMLQ